jgi:hypothetical protein
MIKINKEWMTSSEKKSIVMFYQLLRISNALYYHVKLLNNYHLEKDDKKGLYAIVEETCILLSIIKEAMKYLFSDNAYITFRKLTHSEEITEKYNVLKSYYDNYKTEPNLIIMDHIRNNIQYHFKDYIYNKLIIDGEQVNDIPLCEISENNFVGTMFYPPLNISIDEINRIMNQCGKEGNPITIFIQITNDETSKLYDFIYDSIYNIVNTEFLRKAF